MAAFRLTLRVRATHTAFVCEIHYARTAHCLLCCEKRLLLHGPIHYSLRCDSHTPFCIYITHTQDALMVHYYALLCVWYTCTAQRPLLPSFIETSQKNKVSFQSAKQCCWKFIPHAPEECAQVENERRIASGLLMSCMRKGHTATNQKNTERIKIKVANMQCAFPDPCPIRLDACI
jgi:hypothetical protein